MPRNASGEYTLPAGNPVAIDTVISPTWANPTMDDLGNEITNSLDRNGRGGMLVPFQFLDGTVGAPGLTFTSEPGMGIYRAGTNDMRVVVGGDDRTRWINDSGTTPGQQRPFEIWDGLAWVKPITGSANFIEVGDNVSLLANDANYITSAGAPVQSVNGMTGAVVLPTTGIKSVQRGLTIINSTNTINVPISTINTSKSFLTASCATGVYTVSGVNRTIVGHARIASSTLVQISVTGASAVVIGAQMSWEVVEFE